MTKEEESLKAEEILMSALLYSIITAFPLLYILYILYASMVTACQVVTICSL